jgi:hypothetical protein
MADPNKKYESVTPRITVTPKEYESVVPRAKPRTMAEKIGRVPSSVARGAAIPLTGAALGGAVAGAPGALAGSMVLPAAELVASGLNLIPGVDVGSPYQLAQQGLTKLGFPEPETTLERSAQAVGEGAGGAYGQARSLLNLAQTAKTPAARQISQTLGQQPTLQTIAGGVGAGTTQAVTEKTGSPGVGMAAGLAAGLGTMPFAQKGRLGVGSQQLKNQASQVYQEIDNLGVQVGRSSMKDLSNRLENIAKEADIDADFMIKNQNGIYVRNPEARGVQTITKTPDSIAELNSLIVRSKGPQSIKQIEKQRQSMSAKLGDPNVSPNDKRIISSMVEEIDDFLGNIDVNQLERTGLGQVPANAKDLLNSARSLWKQSAKTRAVEDILESAEVRSAVTRQDKAQAIKLKFAQLADPKAGSGNKKIYNRFSPEEKAEIRKLIEGGTGENFLRGVSRFVDKYSFGLSAGAGAFGAGTLGLSGGGLAAVPPVIGQGAGAIANRLAQSRATGLENLTRLGRQPTIGERVQAGLINPALVTTRAGFPAMEQGLLGPLKPNQ